MKRLSSVLLVVLLMLAVGEGDNDPDPQSWTCGSGGLCRRFCFARESVAGRHGCPPRHR
ncbi:beta-defensin-like 2 [Pseudoliparis swirei]|uniref:beta-defensin-like 2 n=1 Tax=Pseudoliparis swirei TaxID=2059687 RepID=UPI0024BECA67|nr:beta-defensin-like 2 [Pseudoliparis swirei]